MGQHLCSSLGRQRHQLRLLFIVADQVDRHEDRPDLHARQARIVWHPRRHGCPGGHDPIGLQRPDMQVGERQRHAQFRQVGRTRRPEQVDEHFIDGGGSKVVNEVDPFARTGRSQGGVDAALCCGIEALVYVLVSQHVPRPRENFEHVLARLLGIRAILGRDQRVAAEGHALHGRAILGDGVDDRRLGTLRGIGLSWTEPA